MRCISPCTFSLRVKLQLPLKTYLTARFKLGCVALAQAHNGSTAGKPGSNLHKVLPRETHVIETVPVSPLLHTVPAYYFVFYVRDHPETTTDLYSLPSLFPFSFPPPHGFSPFPSTSALRCALPASSPVCNFTRSPADHLQQPGVHQNRGKWREGTPLPGPDLGPLLQRPAGAQTGSGGRPQCPDPGQPAAGG